ncbi:MAG: VCBS repeat-containing protein, partial [Chitinophagaceae bacterium]
GGYHGEEILRFPSSYGSTSFQFADMNADGYRDIIYTCGDNGDVTTVLKPYHGIYIYLNDGKDYFSQSFFYPMHGCYKAIARDFSRTGRPDLAAIAYFTDSSNPEWFVYLRNDGGMKFTAFAAPPEVNFDSALTMDAGDFDHDGLIDIVIGNALDGSNVKGAPFAILKRR